MQSTSFLTLFLMVVEIFGTGSQSRLKRATCHPGYSNFNTGHTMCLDDSPYATPSPLTDAEIQRIVEQHNAYRARENAAGMMKIIWDSDIAAVAQKWSQQCGEGGSHEDSPDKRFVISLPGFSIGQNVALSSDPSYPIENATDQWQNEIKDFEYGTGSKNGGEVGHYTQLVLEDVPRIGCGRSICAISWRTRIVCNYGRAQLYSDIEAPFERCADASCKTPCQTREESSGLCDCQGKVCLNAGTLDKSTCTCSCRSGFSGPSCETIDCTVALDKSYCGNRSECVFISRLADCPTMCGLCTDCNKECQNGGVQNTYPCTCNCPPDWTGEFCEVPVTNSCTKTCAPLNTLDTATCTCIDHPYCALIKANDYVCITYWGNYCCD